jgi:phospholipid/cholesterol/gamma-HCH transport system permease protein
LVVAAPNDLEQEGRSASLAVRRDAGSLLVGCAGPWTARSIGKVIRQVNKLDPRGCSAVRFDLSAVSELDSAGVCLIERAKATLTARGLTVEVAGASEAVSSMIATVARYQRPRSKEPKPAGALYLAIAGLGEAALDLVRTAWALTGFLGQTVVMLLHALLHPGRIRFIALISQMEQSGLRALPIVGLISFLVGVVLAFQGSDQLARFGAQIFTINLVAVGVLREMGILLTAIIIAGRSGSAFTAQIGTMKVNEEIDAMQTIGLDPMEVLVLPRVLGLVLVMPLLTFYSDIMGMAGGGVMVMVTLDMSPLQFFRLLGDAVRFDDFLVGMIKAPIFAFIIAMVGCYEGFQVKSNAESVGRQTTRAVVESIFLVIVLDALLSILFTAIGL